MLNLHHPTKLLLVLLIRQNPGPGIIEIQVGLPGLSVPVLLHFKNCDDRLGELILVVDFLQFRPVG